jgi:hypothetical protein
MNRYIVKIFEENLNKKKNRNLENKVEPPCDPCDPLSCIVEHGEILQKLNFAP